jgi:hypothetical protein
MVINSGLVYECLSWRTDWDAILARSKPDNPTVWSDGAILERVGSDKSGAGDGGRNCE